ncbi:MAG TPA: hypothetical protein VNZ05_05690 [Solirubrobacteraceae bacterium]|nr:hypothetical protein [Solirubrobacteraceae bacterium]
MSLEQISVMRELDGRSSDGLDVMLLWCEGTGQLMVMVRDRDTGNGFVLGVREGERPLEVYREPLAYAAWRRLPGDLAGSPASARALAHSPRSAPG